MPDKAQEHLWRRALASFRNHAIGAEPSDLQLALNRIAAKCIARQPAAVTQSFDASNCSLHEERLSPGELCQLERYHERAATDRDDEPVVSLLYQGRRIVIDGNTRVNKWCTAGRSRLRSVLFIKPTVF